MVQDLGRDPSIESPAVGGFVRQAEIGAMNGLRRQVSMQVGTMLRAAQRLRILEKFSRLWREVVGMIGMGVAVVYLSGHKAVQP